MINYCSYHITVDTVQRSKMLPRWLSWMLFYLSIDVSTEYSTAFIIQKSNSRIRRGELKKVLYVDTTSLFQNTDYERTQEEETSYTPNKTFKYINGIVPRTGPLNEAVANIASITLDRANELINIGAVWAKMDFVTEDDVISQYDTDEPASATIKYADLPKGWHGARPDRIIESSNRRNTDEYYDDNVDDEEEHYKSKQEEKDEEQDDRHSSLEDYVQSMESARYRRIMSPSLIQAGTDLRIYPNPVRFPACYEIDQSRLLYEDTTFIVVDKPPMLPTQPDASNYLECCPGCVNDMLGPFRTITGERVIRPLLCHRVDSCVGGCVVLSKDVNGQRVFAELQRDRKLKKLYLAVTTKPVPLGMHIHWMWASMNKRGRKFGPPCQFVSHTIPQSRRKAKVCPMNICKEYLLFTYGN